MINYFSKFVLRSNSKHKSYRHRTTSTLNNFRYKLNFTVDVPFTLSDHHIRAIKLRVKLKRWNNEGAFKIRLKS